MKTPRVELINSRKLLNLTQEELAQRAQISRAYLTNLESGTYTPSLKVAKRLSEILNKPLEELFL